MKVTRIKITKTNMKGDKIEVVRPKDSMCAGCREKIEKDKLYLAGTIGSVARDGDEVVIKWDFYCVECARGIRKAVEQCRSYG